MQFSQVMHQVIRSKITKFSAALGWIVLTTGLSVGSGLNQGAIAQTQSACQSPRPNEYLLLVRNPKNNTETQLRQLLPANALLTPCTYLNERVVRVEGFATADVANDWAKYLSDQAGLQAIVSSPSSTSVSTPPTAPATSGTGAGSFPRPNTTPTTPTTPATPVATGTSFNPQPLGSGYAVLVSYFNRPELAADVRKVTNRNVGLVSYEQRPYLLAAQGTYERPSSASYVLSKLTQAGLTAVVVDSQGVVLLTADVRR